jgi:hypothetical protein
MDLYVKKEDVRNLILDILAEDMGLYEFRHRGEELTEPQERYMKGNIDALTYLLAKFEGIDMKEKDLKIWGMVEEHYLDGYESDCEDANDGLLLEFGISNEAWKVIRKTIGKQITDNKEKKVVQG